MKRNATLLSAVILFSSLSPALAHACTPANKPVGAGVGSTATFELTTHTFSPTSQNLNPQGRERGGFLTVSVTDKGDVVAQFDVFSKTMLPDKALNAGPGDYWCDGKGIDLAPACAGVF